MNRKNAGLAVALVATAIFGGCGGGGETKVLPQKTAEMTFSTTSTDQSVDIRGISITVTLPAGATVATDPGTNQISSASLKGVGTQVFGSYSAPIRKVTIATLPGTIPLGPYARLTCDITPGITLPESAFTSIIPLDFQPTGPGGASLNNVQSSIGVLFGY